MRRRKISRRRRRFIGRRERGIDWSANSCHGKNRVFLRKTPPPIRMESSTGLLDQALEHVQNGRLAEAEELCRRILAAEPRHCDAWNTLGAIARLKGDCGAAVECTQRALAIKAEFPEALNNLGLALEGLDRFDEASVCFQRAIERSPQLAAAHYNLGNMLRRQGRLMEALTRYEMAIELEPDYAAACNNIGTIVWGEGNPAAAIYFRRAIALDPDYAEAHHNLGLVLQEEGDFQGAEACYERALALAPEFAETHLHRAQLWLLAGDFERGWDEFEWRWKTGQLVQRAFQQPVWKGEPLEGKTILLHAEQGLGDTIQFVRYAALVKERGATVVVEVQPALVRLLARCPGIDRLVGYGERLPPFDVHAPLLSLPRIFRTRLETIPVQTPYLFAEPELVERWRERLQKIGGFRVGINWRGRAAQGIFRKRDIPLECFQGLAGVEGVTLLSLQKEEENRGQGTREADTARPTVVELGELDGGLDAFVDTAAVMRNLDLVITSDTAVAYLAGTLGVPVWVALPFVPDWRWLLGRNDSPWYPSMRLFRQLRRGYWEGVFDKIRVELAAISGR